MLYIGSHLHRYSGVCGASGACSASGACGASGVCGASGIPVVPVAKAYNLISVSAIHWLSST